MTNTKFRKRALLSSVAMLLVALIALGSATFAWFAANPKAVAHGLKLKTTASSGLVIKTDTDATWSHNALLGAASNISGDGDQRTATFYNVNLTPASQNQGPGSAASFYTTEATGAGASFSARGDVFHARETIDIIKQAIRHKGFSLVDVYSICPTYYGRKNKKGDAVEMLNWQKENLIPTARYYSMSEEDRVGKKIIGILSFNDYPEYTEEYAKIIAACRKAKKK